MCGHKNNISLHNSDKIWNVGWGSIIGTATRVWAGWSGIQTLVFFSFSKYPGWLKDPPALFAIGTGVPSWGSISQA